MERSVTILLLGCLLQGVGGQSWTVELPQRMEVLEGSCVRIPCRFTMPSGWERYLDSSCKAKWFRDWRTLVFDSSLTGDPNLSQGQLVGNLLHRDCTTILYNLTISQSSAQYFFKVECNNALKYTFYTGVVITIKDVRRLSLSPLGVEVQEGSPVTLSCSAVITCPLLPPPTLSWKPSLGDAQEEVGAEFVTSVLTFNASSFHHGERISCISRYKGLAGHSDVSFEEHLTINVLYPPVNVSVEWPSGPLPEESDVGLSCNGSANPPVENYTWYRSGPHREPDRGPLGFGRSFTALVSEGTQFYCEARNPYGAQNSSLTRMDVHFPPKEVELRVEPPGGVLEGRGFTLSCSSRSRPPASYYAWYRVSGEAPGIRVRLEEDRAKLTVERAERRHSGQYYCLARNDLGEKESAPVHLDIHFASEILSSSHCVRLPSGVRCSCESRGNPMPSLTWQLAGEAVNHSAHWPIREFPIDNLGIISVISLAQSDEDPPTLVCLSNNSVGVDRLELNLATQPAFHAVSLLIGWGTGSMVMMLLYALFHVTLCRKKRGQRSEETDLGSSEPALARGEEVEAVYANKAALDRGEEEEDLHYANVSFVMLHAPLAAEPGVDRIRGMDSKTAEYAQIRPHRKRSGDGEPQEEEVYAECVSSVQTGARVEVMAEGSLTDAKDSGITS